MDDYRIGTPACKRKKTSFFIYFMVVAHERKQVSTHVSKYKYANSGMLPHNTFVNPLPLSHCTEAQHMTFS